MKPTRALARLGRWLVNRYEGARRNPERSYIQAPLQSARIDLDKASREELQRKARYFEKNSDLLNRCADLFECYTVGCGLMVYASSSEQEWNDAADASFNAWCRFADLVSKQHFSRLQGVIARTWFIDGEIFIIRTKGATGRPRLQLIEAHRCYTPPDRVKDEGETIIDGIEIDRAGRPRGYWFVSDNHRKVDQRWTYYDEKFVIHLFEPSRAGQYRGLPFCHAVINELHDLDDLEVLEMKAARNNARISNVVETTSGQMSAEDFVRDGGSNLGNGTTQEDYVKETLGGESLVLKVGEKLTQYRPDRPSAATSDYWKRKEEKVCAGIGIPRVLVYPDSMQGTVYRGALDSADAFFRARSSVMQDFVRDVRNWVIANNVQIEREVSDPPKDWESVVVHAPRSVNVDVGYTSDAALKEVAAGLGGFATWYGARGMDWRHGLRQKATEARLIQDLAEELDIDPSEISNIQVDRPERIQSETTMGDVEKPKVETPIEQ